MSLSKLKLCQCKDSIEDIPLHMSSIGDTNSDEKLVDIHDKFLTVKINAKHVRLIKMRLTIQI